MIPQQRLSITIKPESTQSKQSFNLKGCFICFLFLEPQKSEINLIPASNCAAALLWFYLAEEKHQKGQTAWRCHGKSCRCWCRTGNDASQDTERNDSPLISFIDVEGPCFVGTCFSCQDVAKNGADFHSSTVSCRVRWFNNGNVTLIREGSKRILEYDKYVFT